MLPSSMSFTNRRQIWPIHNNQHHPLRKQRSLFIDSKVINLATNSTAEISTKTLNNCAINQHSINGVNLFRTNNNSNYNYNNNKLSVIKKQTSVDQIINNKQNQQQNEIIVEKNPNKSYIIDKNNKNNNNYNNNNCLFNKSQYSKELNKSNKTNGINSNNFENSSILIKKNNEKNSFTNERNSNNEFTTSNLASEYYTNRKQHHSRGHHNKYYGDTNRDKNSGSNNRIRKSSKNSIDDKINLNIFLSQNIISSDIDDDDNSSNDEQDNSSSSNKTVKSIEIRESNEYTNTKTDNLQIETLDSIKSVIVEPSLSAGNYNNIRKPLSATARRALFRASKDSGVVVNYSVSFSPGYKEDSISNIKNNNNNCNNNINNKNNNNNNNNNNANANNSNSILKNGNTFTNKRPPSGIIRVSSALVTPANNRISSAKKSNTSVRISSANRILSAKRNNTIQQVNLSSKTSSTINSTNRVPSNNLISDISAAPSLIVERRPPLIRAMSAPIRTLDENSKNILANKRKPRRRKIFTKTTFDNDNNNSDNKLIESSDNCDENNENYLGKNQNRKISSKTALTRSRTTIGIDVVTLVSLISSEESDSEKEDNLSTVKGSPIKRAPPLRKSGKSVSFQENLALNATREYSHMIRRGSIAPLAAKLRSNRPPTAPPVSIFMTDMQEENHSKMDENVKNIQKEEEISAKKSTDDVKDNSSCLNKNSEEEIYQYPEFVKSLKERECWKLFQTMTNKGVAVSYETVLRGMLTPTELRQLLAKRKEIELAEQKAKEIENVAHEEETKKNHKNKSNH